MLLSATPYTMVLFSSYQALRPADGNLVGCFCAGATAGAVLTVPQNPLEIWRVRLQAAEGNKNEVVRKLIANPKSMFRGISMTAIVNVPGNGVMFLTNETLRAKFKSHDNFGLHPVAADTVAGGLTGIIFKMCIYPADLLRSRLMVDTSNRGALDMIKDAVRTRGVAGLYIGASVVVMRACATNSFVWPAFYLAKQYVG